MNSYCSRWTSRPLPRTKSVLGRLAIVAGLLVVGLTLFLRSTPHAFPYGDGAVIEIYTLQALRGFLTLGPYSQFHWHHPGPLMAPIHRLECGTSHKGTSETRSAVASDRCQAVD
jgi:hypothetical protein